MNGAFLAGVSTAAFVIFIVPPFYRRLVNDGHVPAIIQTAIGLVTWPFAAIRERISGRGPV